MKLLIEQEDAQNILNYLLEQKAKEVIGFIATLQRLEPEVKEEEE